MTASALDEWNEGNSLTPRQARFEPFDSDLEVLRRELGEQPLPEASQIHGALEVGLTAAGLLRSRGRERDGLRRAHLAAHVVEEQTRERPMRKIDPENHAYDGPVR